LTREGKSSPAAAYQAYLLAAECWRKGMLEGALKGDAPGGRGIEDTRAQIEELRGKCADVVQQELDGRIANLEIAAQAGVKGAASAFSALGPFGDPQALFDRPDDPLVVAWKREALEYLLRDGNRGDVDVLVQLSTVYSQCEITQRDLSKTLTYLEAAVGISTARGDDPKTAARLANLLAAEERHFSANDLVAIKANARRIVEDCCAGDSLVKGAA
jgi:hypothetical protein